MEATDIYTDITLPEMVETESRETRGLDLLGLRNAAEKVSLQHLSGVNTVTPTLRYLSLYTWVIARYFELGGLDDKKAFTRFSSKVETAFAYANLLKDTSTSGLIGSSGLRDIINGDTELITIERRVKIPASNIYAASARELGITWDRARVPGLTEERGKPLAAVLTASLKNAPVLSKIDLTSEIQEFNKDDLKRLGDYLHIASLDGSELDVLRDAVIPTKPRPGDTARIETYALLLYFVQRTGAPLNEQKILTEASSIAMAEVPDVLHSVLNGWTHFAMRDALVAAHEAAVAATCQTILTGSGEERRMPASAVLSRFGRDIEESLTELGFPGVTATTSVAEFVKTVINQLDFVDSDSGLHRWSSDINEPSVSQYIVAHQKEPNATVCLPLIWILAAARHGHFSHGPSNAAEYDIDRGHLRIGVQSTIAPTVSAWQQSELSLGEACRDLVRRSVEQHLRIAWSRLAREPWKDVAVLASDADEWVYVKPLKAGRPAARLGQAMNWLGQMRFINDDGLTTDGTEMLKRALKRLEIGQVDR